MSVAGYDTGYFAHRDREAFEAAERGDLVARPALLRIAQRDPDPAKRAHAARVLADLERRQPQAGPGGSAAPPPDPALGSSYPIRS